MQNCAFNFTSISLKRLAHSSAKSLLFCFFTFLKNVSNSPNIFFAANEFGNFFKIKKINILHLLIIHYFGCAVLVYYRYGWEMLKNTFIIFKYSQIWPPQKLWGIRSNCPNVCPQSLQLWWSLRHIMLRALILVINFGCKIQRLTA